MSTDWREMEASRRLDALIAEHVGWTNIHCRNPHFDLWSGVVPGGDHGDNIPKYSTSVDAALTLIPDTELGAEMIKGTDSWTVKLVFREGVFKGFANSKHALALAICRAWLAWQESKES